MYYLPDHPLTKLSTTKFPAILDIFLTKVDCIMWFAQWVVAGAMNGQGFNERKFIRKAKGWAWPSYGLFRVFVKKIKSAIMNNKTGFHRFSYICHACNQDAIEGNCPLIYYCENVYNFHMNTVCTDYWTAKCNTWYSIVWADTVHTR